MENEIRSQLKRHCEVIKAIEEELTPTVATTARLLVEAFSRGNKLLVMGNGGSAADAQHFAAEIVGRFKLERRALPAIALNTDTSILTAVSNDYGFDNVFRRQVEALSTPRDVVIGISTSGSSKNVHSALLLAAELDCRTVALLGRDGGSIKNIADIALVVPSNDTPRIQEGHITLIHIICDLVEKMLFPGSAV